MQVFLENIVKRYGSVCAVDRVSFEIADGELFFLLGPSGCGKTTFLRMLAGFETPDEGTIRFDEKIMNAVVPEHRGTGMVFQNYALWPHLSVAQNIAFGLQARHVSAREQTTRVNEVLETVHLLSYRDRQPNQLSGGQQQRVALARALVVQPDLVLLDEPLSNLDARLRQEMRVEIRRIIKHAGHTAVYVTHDRQEALCMADRCAIMRDGKIEQIGSPQQLYCHPVNQFVAEFLGDVGFIEATILSINKDIIQLQTDYGEWFGVATTDTLAPTMKVRCCIRPENWRFAPPAQAPANQLSGVLTQSLFLGELTQHTVTITPELSLSVLELNADPRPSEAVSLWVPAEKTIVLPMETL